MPPGLPGRLIPHLPCVKFAVAALVNVGLTGPIPTGRVGRHGVKPVP